VFSSWPPGDTNNTTDVFVYDRVNRRPRAARWLPHAVFLSDLR
jgi:hypothetical protein